MATKKQIKKLEEQVATMQLKLHQTQKELEAAKTEAKAELGEKLMKYFGTTDVTQATDLLADMPAYVPVKDDSDAPKVTHDQSEPMVGGNSNGGTN
ncbi:hypothetical protein HAU32_07895 [Weissella confusa]|uniref:DUF4315 family protein n=1 Tax=Weissella fermenti TaxID=2987699 RepID=A0ABT6D1D6_9LACO|nr:MULTISPECIES: hypothetical protein [Weissella]MBJ7688893.1 hypothetical protein [Weissella confusa]MCW0926323.1 hypothetical protein [Weissella sp. LMG 11983]MDF9298744.1 hypothetical protein [Weissella sp. BK2]